VEQNVEIKEKTREGETVIIEGRISKREAATAPCGVGHIFETGGCRNKFVHNIKSMRNIGDVTHTSWRG